MKKNTILFIVVSLIFALTACASKPATTPAVQSINRSSSKTAADQIESQLFSESSAQENADKNSSEPLKNDAALQACTVGNITFSVDASWLPQSSMEGTFVVPDEAYAYQLQGISPLGSYEPQEFFDDLVASYKRKYDIISADTALSTYTSPDNVACYRGNIKMLMEYTYFDIDVLIAPQKNTVATFAATCFKDNQDNVDIRNVSDTATFLLGNTDYVTGNAFIGNDGSKLCLYPDNTFANYQYADDYDGDHITGTYEIYYGQPAIDQVAKMTEYGLTADELNEALLAAQNGYVVSIERSSLPLTDATLSANYYQICLDTFYAIILHNDQYITSSGKSMDVGTTMLFLGYYIPELHMLDMTNANTASYAQFIYTGPANQ